jgi:hypothetical protein
MGRDATVRERAGRSITKKPNQNEKVQKIPFTPNFFRRDDVFHNGYSFPGGST